MPASAHCALLARRVNECLSAVALRQAQLHDQAVPDTAHLVMDQSNTSTAGSKLIALGTCSVCTCAGAPSAPGPFCKSRTLTMPLTQDVPLDALT